MAQPPKAMTAMLFDSSPEWAARIQVLLNKSNVVLGEWTRNAAEWVQKWQKSRPTLVIIDLQLPRRDGLYYLQKLREIDADSKVIFTHSYQGIMANDVELKALGLGATTIVQKPFTDVRFTLGLQRVLNIIKAKQKK